MVSETEILAGDPDYRELLEGRRIRMPDLHRSKWQEITKITLPSLVPTIITLLLLSIGRIFYSDFGLFYQVPMNSGVLFPTTNVIDTYVYRALIEQGNISMSSAAGVYQSLVGFCVVMLSNWIVRKVDKDQALF